VITKIFGPLQKKSKLRKKTLAIAQPARAHRRPCLQEVVVAMPVGHAEVVGRMSRERRKQSILKAADLGKELLGKLGWRAKEMSSCNRSSKTHRGTRSSC
jgi:hypothetical protein